MLSISVLQVKWYQQVFGSVGSLGEVYSDVLLSLDPNLNTCIDAALKQHIQPLLLLMELKQLSSAFAHNLQSAITSQGKNPFLEFDQMNGGIRRWRIFGLNTM